MPSQFLLKLAAILVAVVLGVALLHLWQDNSRDRAQLVAELAATKQLLTTADARQHDRHAQLNQTLAALAAEKRTILTPSQIVRDLPNQIPLPAPIVLQSSPSGSPSANPTWAAQTPGSAQPSPGKASPAQTDAVIP